MLEIATTKKEKLGRHLRKCLNNDLPGLLSHKEMAPLNREMEFDHSSSARESAVLIALYPHNSLWHLCFIRRPEYDGIHSGQISLPGGGRELYDSNITATAIREANEEVNINPGKIEILGSLSPIYIPPSNYIVTPVVGILEEQPDFIPQPDEVAEIIEIPLQDFNKPGIVQNKTFYGGTFREIKAPCFKVNSTIIWGATAMILNEFFNVLKKMNKSQDFYQ
ncbi:MAG: NUDIX hydrolase [Bacteroidota bacterium]